MFVEVDRWVKLYGQGGEIVVVKQLAIIIPPIVERVNSCNNCQSHKELGTTACEGCAG